MTIEEFGASVKQKYPQYKNIPDADVGKKVLEKYPVYQSKVTGTPEPKKEGFLESITKPFTSTLASIPSVIGATKKLIESGGKDVAGAQQELGKERDFGPLGKSRALVATPEGGTVSTGEAAKRIIGTGAEIGSYSVPVGIGKSVASGAAKGILPSLKSSIAAGTKLGALGGGLASGGSELATPGSSLGSTALETGKGILGGGAIGGVLGGAGSAVFKTGETIAKGAPAARSLLGSISRAKDRAVKTLGESNQSARFLEHATPAVSNAIRSGIPKEVTEGIQTLAPKTAEKAKQMLDIAEKGSKSLFSKEQPKEVIGKAILEPVDVLLKERDKLGRIYKSLRSQIPETNVDVSDVYSSLRQSLEQKGVIIRPDGFSLRSASASIPTSDAKFYSEVLKSLRPNKEGVSIRQAKFLDNVRQKFFKEYNLSKLSKEPFSDEVDKFVSEMRGQISGKLEPVIPGYQALNEQYAKIMGVLRDFVKLIGYKGNLENITEKELRASEIAMRTLGNAAANADDMIQALFELASSLGFKGSKTEVDQLIRLADLFEALIGSKQTRSLAGQVGRGMSAADRNITETALDGAKSGGIVGMVGGTLSKYLGASTDEQIQALRELIQTRIGKESGPKLLKNLSTLKKIQQP